MARAISSTRKPRTGRAHDDLGREDIRDVEDLGAGLHGDHRDVRPLRPRATPARPLESERLRAPAGTPPRPPACRRRAPRLRGGAAGELLLELCRERAADRRRSHVVGSGPHFLRETPEGHRAQLGHLDGHRGRRRPWWPRAWIDCRTPIAIRFATIDEPPTVTNGSGIRSPGRSPSSSPTLTNTWKGTRSQSRLPRSR